MKTLAYKINSSIADPSAPEFGLSVIRVEKNSPSGEYFGIRFESYYDDVEIEYDDAIKVSEGGTHQETSAQNYARAVEISSGRYTIPKSSPNTIGRYSYGGATVWFPYGERTEVQVKVHHAYHLGGITNTNQFHPTASYGLAKFHVNILDCMEISKIVSAIYFNLYMEEKTFDLRNFIYFPNLTCINGQFSNPGPLWYSQKPDRTYDVDYQELTSTLPADNDTFNRRFNILKLNTSINGIVTSIPNFKVKEFTCTNANTADMFANLLYALDTPFFNGCSIRLVVSDAISQTIRDNLTTKASNAGGTITFS